MLTKIASPTPETPHDRETEHSQHNNDRQQRQTTTTDNNKQKSLPSQSVVLFQRSTKQTTNRCMICQHQSTHFVLMFNVG